MSSSQNTTLMNLNTSNREVRVNCSGSSTSETSSASFAKTTNQSVQGNQILPNKNCFGQKFSGRVTLVDKEPVTFQWEITTPSTCRHVHDNRCLPGQGGVHLAKANQQGVHGQERNKNYVHINVLELKAIKLALLTFTKFRKINHLHLQIDNMTALSYLLKMGGGGGTHSMQLLALAKEIWDYLLSRQITITAEYIPSHLNVIADRESREIQDRSEWKLSPVIFQRVCRVLGTPDIDLFTSRTSHQVPAYMAWKPDPGSIATDALQQSWSNHFPYAFPPFCLIGRVLAKLKKEKVRLLLVTPTWQTQTWYSMLIGMSVRNPILLPHKKNLLLDPRQNVHPLVENKTLQLAVWVVSGIVWQQKAYQTGLQSLSQIPEGRAQFLLTNRPGESGLAGVVNGKLIPFDVL